MTSGPSVLDARQLARIEGTHRGFLYQHMYAVSCLLMARDVDGVSISVETDEDIEFQLPDVRLYVQVKTRARPLRNGDISRTLETFRAVRAAHESGAREGNFGFCIVSNAPPDSVLLEFLSSTDWPPSIGLAWPGRTMPHSARERVERLLPPAFENIGAALLWCTERAQTIPYSRLPPESLVWKLAALAQCAAAGEPPYVEHRFNTGDLPMLFEQVTIQLQEVPAPPSPYRPLIDEPQIESGVRAKLVVGHSGSGKTSWASQQAVHYKGPIAYYNVSEGPDAALAPALARELAAKWLAGNTDAVSTILYPGASGLDSLRALDLFLRSLGNQGLVVIDNAHEVEPRRLKEIVMACPSLRFVLLAQPWDGRAAVEVELAIQAIFLRGWPLDAIAAEFAAHDCPIPPDLCDRVQRLTGGFPLYVRNSAELAARHYGGDAAAFCAAREQGEQIGISAQQAILTEAFNAIGEPAKNLMALLSLASAPLEREETFSLASSVLAQARSAAAQQITHLESRGMVNLLQGGRILIHDAFRPLAVTHRAELGEDFIRRAASQLRQLLEESIKASPDHSRSVSIIRLLPLTGDTKTLVSFALDEFFYEYGFADEFDELLGRIASDTSLSPEDQFWALDAVAFRALTRGAANEAEEYVSRMEALLPGVPESVGASTRILPKQLLIAGIRRDAARVESVFAQCADLCAADGEAGRVIRYDHAAALFKCGHFERSEKLAFDLAIEYYDNFDLDWQDVFAKNVPEIGEILGDKAKDQVTVKHLADCLDLYAISRNKRGLNSGLARLHALKFYEIAFALSSLVRVGQDVVDELLDLLCDPQEARKFIEHSLLPTIRRYNLLGHLVAVRGQYAVILAYCSEFALARDELKQLQAFHDALSTTARQELSNQERLVGAIEQGEVRLPSARRPALLPPPNFPGVRSMPKVGRNQPCPCGSGQKYKRCHGK